MNLPKIEINSNPFITSYNFMILSDHIWIGDDLVHCKSNDIKYLEVKNGIDPMKVKDGDIIYVITDLIDRFFKEIHPKIKNKYILISGRTDNPLEQVKDLIDDKIIKWYSSNLNDTHHKLVPIPLGIQNPHWRKFNNPEGNIKLIESINNEETTKIDKILMAFQPHTNPEYRLPIYNYFKEKEYITLKNYNNGNRGSEDFQKEYYREIRKHKFVVCPQGAGFDCHRNWETWSLGTYPIIKKHKSMENFYDMPAWFVNDWSEVTKENMEHKYNEINNNSSLNLDKIHFNYWLDIINKNRI